MSTSKLNIDHLSENECERILGVLQRDYHLRNRERTRLRSLEKEIWQEQQRRDSLINAGQHLDPQTNKRSLKVFSKHCIGCLSRFSLLFNRPVKCVECKQQVCRVCTDSRSLERKEPRCTFCDKQIEYNRHSSDWTYDSENRKFKRTYSGEIADTISRRLSEGGDYHSVPIVDDIPSLSLKDFEQSMENLLKRPARVQENDNFASQSEGTDSLNQSTGTNLLDVNDFFQSSARAGDNVILTDKLENELDNTFAEHDDVLDESEEVAFSILKEEETKRFLIDVNSSVAKIKDSLVNNDTESQTEDMLTVQRSVLSSLVANLEQSLHLAVDRQASTGESLVRHKEVARIVCSIVEEFVDEKLSEGVMAIEGTLDYGEVADCILLKILDEVEASDDDEDKHSPESTVEDWKESAASSTDASYSDYGSYKFPSFGSSSMEVDPDLLSLGQGSAALLEEEEEDALSEESGPWDSESVVSASSSNWLFRGKNLAYDTLSLSGKSSLFNAHSTSEESVNLMFVPQPTSPGSDSRRIPLDAVSDDGSDLTLASSSDSLSSDALNLTPRAILEEDMIRTELRRTNHHVGGAKPGYVSVSRNASTSTPTSDSKASEYSEIGEESNELRFPTKPKTQTVMRGNVAKFTCTVSGESPIDVYWFKEGVNDTDALETNDKYEVSSDDDRHTLEVFFTSPEDNGQYLCLAKNDVTSSHWLFGLTVEESTSFEEKPPLFLKELYDMEAVEGDTVKLSCKVRAYPPPRVSWYKDGQRIDKSHCYKLDKFGNRDYVLTIIGVTTDHDAEFTVMAKNGAGEAKSSAQLIVEPLDREEKSQSSGRERVKRNGQSSAKQRDERRRPLSPVQLDSLSILSIVNSNMSLTVEDEPAATNKSPSININQTDLPVQPEAKPAAKQADESHSRNVMEKKPSDQENVIGPRRSLRAAMRSAGNSEKVNHGSEAENTVKIKLSQRPTTVSKSERPTVTNSDSRHSTAVELLKISPLNTEKPHLVATTEDKEIESHNSKHAENNTTSTPKVVAVSQIPESPSHICETLETTRGIDIQPGFVRERQFQEMGDDISPIRPIRHKKGAAPLPPVKIAEVIELTGSSEHDDLPSSRGEWSGFFPSVKQRRQSLSSEASGDNSRSASTPNKASLETNNNDTKPPVTSTKKKGPAPPPPTQSSNKPDNVEPKKKTVRKVVKRTVSVKRTTLPASFEEGAPDDGCDYIKVCGNWVKMKSKRNTPQSKETTAKLTEEQRTRQESTSISTHDSEEDVPRSRSEWGDNLPIGKQMKAFKQSQEAKGTIITGRSLGPITKV